MPDPPAPSPPERVTRILGALQSGERDAARDLLPLVYEDLRRLAAARIGHLGPGQSLQATELVHDAYMRLVGPRDPGWEGRAHFFGAAARAMRNVVADLMQQRSSQKRGGHCRRIGDDTAAELTAEGPSDDVLAVEEALAELERMYPRRAEVVTLMFYGGLTAAEVAALLDVSDRTVEREWRFAKAWLNGRLTEREPEA